jgi:DNA-binding protein H-NS
MSPLSELLTQREALERQIQAAQAADKSRAIAEVKRLMALHGLTATDIAAKPAATRSASSERKVAPKYQDPETGASWSGRGLRPRWLVAAISSGRQLEEFAI